MKITKAVAAAWSFYFIFSKICPWGASANPSSCTHVVASTLNVIAHSFRSQTVQPLHTVKLTIAKQEKWSPTMKEHAVVGYTCYLKMYGITWEPPKYRRIAKIPFIPTETEVDQLIASCNKKVATFLQLLKETGMRSGEAWGLEWIDFNFEERTVRVTPEKGGNPRLLKISNKLVAILNSLPKDQTRPFNGLLRHFARTFPDNEKE